MTRRRHRIYVLAHPTTGAVRYVGCTTLPLAKRLRQHATGNGSYMVAAWVARLGRLPRVRMVAHAYDPERARGLERAEIARHVRRGRTLLNDAHRPDRLPLHRSHKHSPGPGPETCTICDRAKLDTLRKVG